MLLKVLPAFQSSTRVHLGDDRSTIFWFDHWIGPSSLATMFPALLSHCSRPNIMVADVWSGASWSLPLAGIISSAAAGQQALLVQALQQV